MLIYGAYGYSGKLIVEEALEQGLRPLLAGRHAGKIKDLADRYGLPSAAFDLSNREALSAAVNDQRLVLNCAGPFSHTFRPVVEACLQRKVHYLDITGEIAVFEALAQMHAAAVQSGIMLLPGVGFDVVPTDCLAAHLKSRLPDATQLALALCGGGGLSRGTRRSMLESLGRGAVRRDGRIVAVPPAWKTREVDFGEGAARSVVTIPWGDVATAWYSTGIPNIETYVWLPARQIRMLHASRYLGGLLRSNWVQGLLQRHVSRGAEGPSATTRKNTQSLAWGEVRDPAGRIVQSHLRCANAYSFTARAAVAAARRILGGDVHPGFQTPSRVFGIGFALALGARIADRA